jgi:MFS family permease
MSPEKSGGLLTPLVLTTAVFSVVGGLCLVKTKRYKKLVLAGLFFMMVGTLSLATISTATNLHTIMAAMIVAGVGLGLLLPVYTIIIQSAAPEKFLGISTGLSQFVRSVGGTLGTAGLGFLFVSLFKYNLHQIPGVGNAGEQAYLTLLNMHRTGSLTKGVPLFAQHTKVLQAFIASVDVVFLCYGLLLCFTLILNFVLLIEVPLREKN